jgi:cysteine desulfurase
MARFYLDHAATTPVLPEVRSAMSEWMEIGVGNPSSLHADGRRVKAAIDESRERFADAFGCLFGEVVFCSSGTEAANFAVIGGALAERDRSGRDQVVLAAADHHCVVHCAGWLARLGFEVFTAPADRLARVDMDRLSDLVGDRTALVAAMHANNELGTFNDVAAIGRLCRNQGALFVMDAVQTFPASWRVGDFEADIVFASGHKFGGPAGVGVAYVRGGVKPVPLIVGGGQEREVRAGTENVLGVIGAGVAVELAGKDLNWREEVRAARDAFESRLDSAFVRSVKEVDRLPGHVHVRWPGIDAEHFLIRLDREGVSASSGAACSSGSVEPSHVLLACGYTESEANEGLRFTFGRGNTVDEAVRAAEIVNAVGRDIAGKRRAQRTDLVD